ncbi:stage III sporulation protein AC [Caminicella sporogenes DSM 14501]|uniref:Stage III sporulation protein AC n=1 Tax=Caminicella sporogenes DSM 14501 TaxID=1121266 RepID=A0A1M6LMJ6_9FIRM|nr:stage III sporulation protein AC [Caminicella sporogenes]RKD27882.1 stage III sporulation protein AC [Caminicella sporogenes]WIF94532.1 stage III sporulation protein AC [Caminicella sporogenes]SHJ72355.1 stage III sporulation protein AC [Caminicella sporogenes DSM 14501]
MALDINMIFKIAAIGILVSVLNMVLKHSGREEMAMMTTITGLIIVLFMIINIINNLFSTVKTMFEIY